MRPIVSPELVNGVFGDPALYLDFRFERRALLIDLGDLNALPPKKILRLTDVFVSHTHMDHFSGFDRLLRICLGRGTALRLYGPPGFLDQVEHKLASYTWNLVENYAADFSLLVHELAPGTASDAQLRVARFRSHDRFRREAQPDRPSRNGVLLDEPAFRVRAAILDHGIACLAFAFEEKAHVNVWKNRLAEIGLPTGPWLKELKRAIAEDRPDDTPIRAWWTDRHGSHEKLVPLGELKAHAVQLVQGERLCYATDFVNHAQNQARLAQLAADADLLFIESVFLAEDGDHAARKLHLTAEQAGWMARAAGAKHVVPFHFSPRYAGREAELRAELERARSAG